ncbi:hypothetical protein LAZ67_4001821 [Cordylochernes scorpioides]|uniref:Uncharacterized protein n=1 Tax=Cordylochernes scorpioides TaxID=51811 RepID=A0ABY6KCI0_9ARAC|nr:hypothetical protein LAZ67_4001821 [Cordylochernes scorpioides]
MKAIPKTDYQRCFSDWKKKWLKCIAVNGDYFEGDNLNLCGEEVEKDWKMAFPGSWSRAGSHDEDSTWQEHEEDPSDRGIRSLQVPRAPARSPEDS